MKKSVAQMPDNSLFISVLTVGEITRGIALLETGKRKNALITWLDGLQSQFSERIIPIDEKTAELWGNLTARLSKTGISIPSVDGLIAATALRHDMCIMTRNMRHFEHSGATIIDPWND